MESQPQSPEFRNNPENFPPCYMSQHEIWYLLQGQAAKALACLCIHTDLTEP